MNIKPIYVILILLTTSIGVYYNSLNGEFFNMDDKEILKRIENPSFNIKGLFTSFGDIYYRPFFIFSFYVDYLIWKDKPFGYHLHNVIVHAFNTVLAYIFSLMLLFAAGVNLHNSTPVKGATVNFKNSVAFFAALLFSVHPLQTEAVNWISARGDLYAVFFLLLALIFYLLDSKIPLIPFSSLRTGLIFSSIFYLLSILSKESTIILPLILWSLGKITSNGTERLKILVFYFSPPALIYLLLRYLSMTDGGIGIEGPSGVLRRQLFQPLIQVDFFAVFLYMLNFSIHLLSSLGFYFKKLLYPFPLNFAIYEIDARYEIIGCLIILIFIFWRRLPPIKSRNRTTALQGLKTFLIYSSIVSLLPVFFLSLGNVAWTIYAERYLYLPSVFFCILIGYGLWAIGDRLWAMGDGRWAKSIAYRLLPVTYSLLPIAYCLWFSVATYQRNEIWRTNISLWSDTVKKSSDFGYLHIIYGDSLAEKGYRDKAKEEFNKALILGEQQAVYHLGLIAAEEGDYEIAEKYFLSATMATASLNIPSFTGDAFEKLADLYIKKISEFPRERQKNVLRVIEYYKKRNKKRDNPEILFKIEQLYSKIGLLKR